MRLGLLSDLHLVDDPAAPTGAWHNPYDSLGVPERVAIALEQFADADVDAVALLGDLAHHGSVAALDPLRAALDAHLLDVLVVAGNHDRDGAQAIADTLGAGVRLATPAGAVIGDAWVAGVHVAPGGWFAARLQEPPAVAAWPQDTPVVLLSHFPLLSHAGRLAERGLPYPGDVLGRAEITDALIGREQPTVVLSGHIHTRDASVSGSVLQLTSGALVEPPYEWAIVDVDLDTDGAVVVRRTAISGLGPAPLGELPTLVGQDIEWRFSEGRWIVTRTTHVKETLHADQ